jgi:hypothetical protein
MRQPLRLLIILAVLLMTGTQLDAQWKRFGEGIFINLPVSWKVLEVTDEKATCANDAEEAFFILKRYSGSAYEDAQQMDRAVRQELGGGGAGEAFRFQGRDAVYGMIGFSQNGREYEGFLLVIDSPDRDITAVSFVETGYLEAYREMLLSVLDSLSLGEAGLINPGPVSIFDSPRPSADKELFSLQFDGESLPVAYSEEEARSSQELIEREAEVLNVYGGTEYANRAWKRYYRLLYRDLYGRLNPIYTALRQHIPRKEYSKRELAELLLRWVQGFTYVSTGTLSDCLSPITGALRSEGDCDSRGLLYVVMMHRFDVDAILMVSSRYKHSVAAVDVSGEGARFPYEGKEYLIAETTEEVDLGLIEQSMSAIEGWLGIDFPRPGAQ